MKKCWVLQDEEVTKGMAYLFADMGEAYVDLIGNGISLLPPNQTAFVCGDHIPEFVDITEFLLSYCKHGQPTHLPSFP